MLLDTSGLLSLVDAREKSHSQAVECYRSAQRRLTHSYVVAEFIPLAQARGISRQRALVFMSDLLADPRIETVWVDQALIMEAFELLQRQLDKQYSLCDAVSMILMRQRGILEAMSTDHHFAQAGFIPLLK